MRAGRKNEARWNEGMNRWEISVQADGQRKKITGATGANNKREKIAVERRADEWLEKRLTGENAKVSAKLDEYLTYVEENSSAGNYHQVRSNINAWLRPMLGGKRCGALTEIDLQNVLNRAARPLPEEERMITGAYRRGELNEKSLKNLRYVLVQFVKYLRKSQCSKLMLEGLQIPRSAEEADKKILQPSEVATLFNSCRTIWHGADRNEWYVHLFRFSVASGLRPGEVLGLKNLDISGNSVKIRRSIDYYGNETAGKNKRARRTVVLTQTAMRAIAEQREQLRRAGIVCEWIFPDEDGDLSRQQNVRNRLVRYCEANGITPVSPYELRHTYISLNKEMPEALLKLQVGHGDSMDTQGTYGHIVDGDLQRAASFADSIFRKILKV